MGRKKVVKNLSTPMTISVMMKIIMLAAIGMEGHAVTILWKVGTIIARNVNASIHMIENLKCLVKTLILQKPAKNAILRRNVRPKNAKINAGKHVIYAEINNQYRICP